jgi:hypothetical protein
LVGCVVDKDDFAGCFDEVFGQLGGGKRCRCGGLELRFPVGEWFVVGVVEGFLGGAEVDEGEVGGG